MKLTHKLAVFCFAFGVTQMPAAFAGEPVSSGKEEALILNDEEPWLVKPTLDTRVRYEYGALEGKESSHNGSIRNRVGLLTKEISGFQFFGEYEGTLVADRDSYRAASVHGPTSKTIIADPESHELNQLWGSYTTSDGFLSLKAGRQAIALDGQRFVGGVAWRQNMQTYDAATLKIKPADDLSVSYSYVNQVNRIFGSDVFLPIHTDFEGNSHLINAQYKGLGIGTLTTYAYLLDLTNEAGSANSNNTFGLSLAGDLTDSMKYYLEYAYQTDAFDSGLDYGASYAHGSVSSPLFAGLKGTVGLEYLGGDNGVGFKTPLATLHKFNGFGDVFLSTPGGGLTDAYASVGTKLPGGIGATAAYHFFWDDEFGISYGQEADVVLSKDLGNGLSVLGKGAFFFGDEGYGDLTRISVELNYKF